MSLLVGELASDFGGAGATAGAIGGILAAMTSPVLGLVMVLSLLPAKLLGVGVTGAAGAFVGTKLFARLIPPEPDVVHASAPTG